MALSQDSIVQSEIRRTNLSRMMRELHLGGSRSRSQLARRLELNRSTIASLVGELSARGLVWERPRLPNHSQPQPGRPSPVVELRPDGPSVLAVEVSTDWIRVAVIGLDGAIAASARLDRSLALASPEQVVADVVSLARPLLDPRSGGGTIIGVGVSVPGAVRHEDGTVRQAPNLGWRDVPLGSLMRGSFAGLPVYVSNDSDLAALAEHLRGSGRGAADFVCLWGEGGLGAGLVLGGQRITGAAGYAGEVGHIMVDPAGSDCRCGARGCWETEVAEGAVLRRAGRDPSGGSPAIAALLADADAADAAALGALAETGRWLGAGIAGLVNIFNPSRIALGGFYARIYPYAREAIAAELDRRAMSAPRGMTELTLVSLGADALLLGAAELAFEPTLHDPTNVPPIPSQEAGVSGRPANPGRLFLGADTSAAGASPRR